MPSLYQEAAARRFPFSAKRKLIAGDGPYYLVSKCRPNAWYVYLFKTPEARDVRHHEWFDMHCGVGQTACSQHNHECGELMIRFHG